MKHENHIIINFFEKERESYYYFFFLKPRESYYSDILFLILLLNSIFINVHFLSPNINAYQQTQGHVPIGTHQQKHEWLPTTKPVCFVDAAWNAASKDAGVVWRIISDLSPQALSGSQVIEDVSSPLVAEALALYKGVRKAIDLGFVSISFLSDCSTLIRAINNRRQIKEIYGILQDINSLSSLFVSVSFRHINRSQNDEADFLAKEALKAHCIFSSFSISSGPTTWA